jgi:uncharacterized repeat protein (TIGR03843 family)
LVEEPKFDAQLRLLAGFDLLLNNADRKGGHILRSKDDEIFAIDNGLSFHVVPKLRTVMWEYAGDPLPHEIEVASERLVAGVPESVASLLAPREQAALQSRARDLLLAPFFPIPDPNRRNHPWPLV